ncbi:MAG: hypothetical protein LBJ73_00035 [Rickettsiales bacterium]|jgi:hypothetical protein|nr:hypothetical protein [Rickettsiales bacterium]
MKYRYLAITFAALVVGFDSYAATDRSWYQLHSLGMVVNYGSDSGKYHKAGKIGCDKPGNCIRYSVNAISADYFTAFPFLYSGDRGISFGPWIGQDVGWGAVGGEDFMFGTTYLGGVLYANFADVTKFYISAGYAFSYGGLFSPDEFEMDSTRGGFTFMVGNSFTPFRGTLLAPFGINFNFKFVDMIPQIRGTTPDTAGKYNLSTFATFGFFVKF